MPNEVRRNEGEAGKSLAQRTQAMWDPFRLVQEMFRWGEPLGTTLAGGFVPRFEMTEGKDAYVVSADLPGVEEDNVEISLIDDRLTISGHREQEHHESGARVHTSERTFGQFTRSFTLPEGADRDHLRAELNNGVLTLTIPKRREVQPKRIAVAKRGKGKA